MLQTHGADLASRLWFYGVENFVLAGPSFSMLAWDAVPVPVYGNLYM